MRTAVVSASRNAATILERQWNSGWRARRKGRSARGCWGSPCRTSVPSGACDSHYERGDAWHFPMRAPTFLARFVPSIPQSNGSSVKRSLRSATTRTSAVSTWSSTSPILAGGFNWSSQHLKMEVWRWVSGSVSGRSVRCGGGCGRRVGRRRRSVRIGCGFGKRSRVACRARTRCVVWRGIRGWDPLVP